MVRNPVAAAPYTMEMPEISDSVCTNVPPTSGRRLERYSNISVWGVIG